MSIKITHLSPINSLAGIGRVCGRLRDINQEKTELEIDMASKRKTGFVMMVVFISLVVCSSIGCFSFLRSDCYLAPFDGKVIDADTKKPIEGAAVLAVYHGTTASIAGSNTYAVDAQETLTDANEEFKIPTRSIQSEKVPGRPRGNIIIFKPGYGAFPRHEGCKAVGESETWPPPNKYIVYELPKLKTREEIS